MSGSGGSVSRCRVGGRVSRPGGRLRQGHRRTCAGRSRGRTGGPTRHYYNPLDGLPLDASRYPEELIGVAESLLALLEREGTAALGPGTLSSLRATAFSGGRLEFLAVMLGGKRPTFMAGAYIEGAPGLEAFREVALDRPELFVSLKELTLSLRGADGAVVLVDPVGERLTGVQTLRTGALQRFWPPSGSVVYQSR
ncbi:MAG: hypothetical protein HY815_30005 [Candidatus Riflebacteria bacterium]|nr:hypothetical protein [Candidatus Riflebacteria bacterium]